MHRLLWFALATPALCHAADISLQAVRHGDSFEVEAAAEFEAEMTLAWEVLTDYDRLSARGEDQAARQRSDDCRSSTT